MSLAEMNQRFDEFREEVLPGLEIEEETVPDLVVFSPVRWDLAFDRPQQLMSRFARDRRVFYFEDPIFHDGADSELECSERLGGVIVVTPILPKSLLKFGSKAVVRELEKRIEGFIHGRGIVLDEYTAWYYSPIALEYTRQLTPTVRIFDGMGSILSQEVSRPNFVALERELLAASDLVFTDLAEIYPKGDPRLKHRYVLQAESSEDFAKVQALMAKLENEVRWKKAEAPVVGKAWTYGEGFQPWRL